MEMQAAAGAIDASEYTDSSSDEENPISLNEEDYNFFLPYISLQQNKVKLFDKTCSICIDELGNGSKVRQIITCKHAFHDACLIDWIKINESCPNCKEDLNKLNMIEKLKKTNPKKVKHLLDKENPTPEQPDVEDLNASARPNSNQRRRRRRAGRQRQNLRRVDPPPPMPQRVVRRMNSVNQQQQNPPEENRQPVQREGGTIDLDSSNAFLNMQEEGLTDSEIMRRMQLREIELWERQGEGDTNMIPVQMV